MCQRLYLFVPQGITLIYQADLSGMAIQQICRAKPPDITRNSKEIFVY